MKLAFVAMRLLPHVHSTNGRDALSPRSARHAAGCCRHCPARPRLARAANELSYAVHLIHSRNFRGFEATFVGTGIYLLMSIALRHLLNWAGPRLIFGR